MENMTKRNQTVLIVANALVNIQSGYFLYDDELYPCTLSKLASETGFHESTISRTLNNKYYSFNGEYIIPCCDDFSNPLSACNKCAAAQK